MKTIQILFYRDFYDFPRSLVLRHRGLQLLLESAFDDDLDDYPDRYSVFLLPDIEDEYIKNKSWTTLNEKSTNFLGQISTSTIKFDVTKRQSITAEAIDNFLDTLAL